MYLIDTTTMRERLSDYIVTLYNTKRKSNYITKPSCYSLPFYSVNRPVSLRMKWEHETIRIFFWILSVILCFEMVVWKRHIWAKHTDIWQLGGGESLTKYKAKQCKGKSWQRKGWIKTAAATTTKLYKTTEAMAIKTRKSHLSLADGDFARQFSLSLVVVMRWRWWWWQWDGISSLQRICLESTAAAFVVCSIHIYIHMYVCM